LYCIAPLLYCIAIAPCGNHRGKQPTLPYKPITT
jgi:hypothetical protein